jgi:NAD(P)-dependent dehydrogenase (short-subunit alcohol dehydrogenase family)
MAVNAWVPLVLSRAFAQQIGQGKIVNLLDSRLKGYDWTHVGYIPSKHQLAALTRMMALEFAPHITVNAVAPGLVLAPPGKDESYLQSLVQADRSCAWAQPKHGQYAARTIDLDLVLYGNSVIFER